LAKKSKNEFMLKSSIKKWSAILVLVAYASLTRGADTFVYFGSHGKGPQCGFSLAHFDTDTGKLTTPEFLLEAVAPAYFIISPDKKHLYTCNSAPGSSVSAYAIDPATAKLTFINQKPSDGGDPSYVSLDATGHFLMIANFQGGSIAVFALQPDGSIGERSAYVQHAGTNVITGKPIQAHAHSIRVDPSNRYVLAADLGLDKLFVYQLDPKTGALQPNDPPSDSVPTGSGPRHTAFHPNGRYVYLINQMGNTIIRFGWDAKTGRLTQYESVSTLPEGFKGKDDASEILVHPSGKFIYATNRGNNSVAVFSVDADSGRLTLLQHISTQGKTPRNCEFDPTGRWLLVSNQDSSNAVVFRIDANTGRLTQVGEPVKVLTPFCERFLPVAQ
jgi:6-phosphogluconolactonase